MRYLNIVGLGLSLIFSSHLVLANDNWDHVGSYLCTAREKNLRQNGERLPVDARLYFNVRQNAEGVEKLVNLVGHVAANNGYGDADDTCATYYGVFNIKEALENTKYRPRRYKGYSQFQNINATATAGNEDGMWGELVIQNDRENTNRNSKKSFKAHYIFQAGDHMGGTIDFTCVNQW